MKENLKVTKYKDGALIPYVTNNISWLNLSTPGYCFYNNSVTGGMVYGALYNWYTVNTGKLCPTGWHVPSDAEWTTLTTFLGGISVAGGKLKSTGTTNWITPNTGADNSSGFTALPSGDCSPNRTFYGIGIYGQWWSSTVYSSTNAWNTAMYNYSISSGRGNNSKQYGFSIRCVQD